MKAAGYAAAVVAAREIGYPVVVTPDGGGSPRFVVTEEGGLRNAVSRALIAASNGCVDVRSTEDSRR
jgi:biotin carboxylase